MSEAQLSALLAQVIAEARALSIPVSGRIDSRVRINRRAQSRFGCCIGSERGYFIELSAQLLAGGEKLLRQVLAHEVLHTCRGCDNHGKRWQSYARRMNEAYGYHIRATDTHEALGLVDERPFRYLIQCRSCGRQFRRMRRSAVVDAPHRYHCPCGGQLEVERLG